MYWALCLSDVARSVPNERRREITMVNQQQLDLLKQGVATAWNTWREEHPDTPITLNGVDLSEANLGELNLAVTFRRGSMAHF